MGALRDEEEKKLEELKIGYFSSDVKMIDEAEEMVSI